MSDNESKLVFDTLIGSDTLTKALEKQLGITKQIKDSLKDIKKNSDKVKTPLDKAGVTLVDVSSLKTGIQLLNAMVHGKDALAKMSSVFNTKDITTVEGIVGAMSKLLSLTEKYSQFSNKKLQLAAFDGSLNEKQFNANKKNIDALKAMNKGFAQSGDTSSKFAKEGIRLVEEHNKKLKEQGRIERENASQKVKESKDTRATLKRKAFEGSLTRTDIDKAKTPQGLKAIQAGLVDRQHLPNLTAAERKAIEGLERSVQTKLTKLGVTPFEIQSQHKFTKLSDFETSGLTKGESKVGLSLLARRIATMKKEGATYAQVVKQEELLQAARDLHAKNFRPASAFQLREAENLRVAKLPQNMPLANLSSLTSRDEVARQLRMSNIRSKEMSEGSAKNAEILYADALKAHGKTLVKVAKTQDKISKSFIAEMQSKAEKGLFTRHDSRQITDLAQVGPLRKSLTKAVDNKDLTQSQRLVAAQARHELRLREIALKGALKVIDPVARASGLNRDAKNAALQSDPKHYNTAIESGTRAIIQKTEQLRKTKVLEAEAKANYNTTASLTNLSKDELVQAKRIINYRKNMADANSQQEKHEISLLGYIKTLEQTEADRVKAAKKLKTHNDRMATDAGYRLAQQQKANVAATEADRKALASTANDRVRIKAENEARFKSIISTGYLNDPANIQKISGGAAFKEARDTLNFQAHNGASLAERQHAGEMLRLLKEKEALETKSIANQTLVAELAKTHYRTAVEINTLGRSELEIAKQVLAFRIRNAATQTEAWHQQQLLNQVNTNSGLQNKAANRLNPEVQAENRAGSRERILGDAGASVLTIQAGLMLNYKLLAGMQGLFSNAIGSVIELDSAFRQLQAISASTNNEMVSMKQNLILVAQSSKFSAAEVGNTAVLLAQAGYSIGEISQSMKGVIALAQATGTDLGKSVDVVTSVLSVFNKGAGETDQVVNQLTEALNRSKLDINKVALGIQYAGNIAADSGITFEELTASLGAMANAGIRSGSTLGTGLRQMFIDLQKPSEKLKEKLSSLGLSLDQVDLKSYGLIGVLENLKNAGFTTGDAFKTFEVRAASAFAALSGNMDDFNQLKEGLNDTTAAFDANGVQLEALAVQLDHLKSNLGILSAEALMPVAALVRDLAKATAHAMEKTEEGSGTLQKFGTVLTGLTVAIAVGWMAKLAGELIFMTYAATRAVAVAGALRLGFLGLAASMSAGMSAVVPMGAALATFAPILIGVVVGVGAVVAAFSAWGRETDKLNDKLDKAKAAFNKAKESVDTAKTAYDNVNEAIDRLADKYGVLKESQIATTGEAESLVTKFGDMGFAIDDLANVKVQQLMDKLRELRGELAQEYKSKIGQQLAAKIGSLFAGNEVATSSLASDKFSKESFVEAAAVFSSRGKTFPVTEGGVQAQEQIRNIANPALLKLLSDTLLKIQNVQKEGGLPKDFNLGAEHLKLTQAIVSSGVGAYQQKAAEDFFTEVIEKAVNAYKVRENFEHNKVKASREAQRSESRVSNDQASLENNKAVGNSILAKLQFEEKSSALDATKLPLKARELAKGNLGEIAVKVMKANLAEVDKILDTLNASAKILEESGKAGTQPHFDLRTAIGNKEAEKAKINEAMQAPQDAVDKALGIKSKGKLQDLQILKGTLEEKLKALDRDANSETGVSKQAAKAQLADNMQRQIDAVELQILELSVKKDADLDFQRVQTLQKQTVRLNDRKREEEEKQKNLKAAVEKRTTDIDSDTERTKLTDYKQAQQDWVEANNLSDELFAKAQSAARKRAALQSKKVLNAGNMFKDINKDLAKAAQDAANATGQAQEYSSYGTGIGGFFARQAANAKNGVNEGKLKQEALAREFLQLKASEDHYSALKLEETIPKAQKELAAKNAELKAIDDKLKNSNLSDAITQEQTRKDLQVRIDRIKEQLKTDEDLLKMGKEDRERRLATIERLTEDLAAMQDKTNVFADSFAAGRQALDAGLSAGFSDWATQTIKNIDDVEAAFKSMGLSILQSMLKVVSDRTAMAFTNMLLGKADGSTGLGLIGSLGSAFFSNASSAAAGAAGIGNGAISLGMSSGGFVNGNAIPHFANGGATAGTDIGRDSIPAYLRPDEYVLRPSATAALGKPFLDRLNATTTGSLKQLEGKAQAPQVNVTQTPPVNVWVVSPDQKNQMGANDVVAVIEDNISRNGSVKRLIKSVISGEA